MADQTGYLYKQGKGLVGRGWKKRWFELRNSNLFYFLDRGGKNMGSVNLASATSILAKGKSGGKFVFTITCPDRVWSIAAESSSTRDSWIAALEGIIERSKQGKPFIQVSRERKESYLAVCGACSRLTEGSVIVVAFCA